MTVLLFIQLQKSCGPQLNHTRSKKCFMEGDFNMWIDDIMKVLALDALLLELEGEDVQIDRTKIDTEK